MRRSVALLLVLLVASAEEDSPFAPSALTTPSGEHADPDAFFSAADCGECHVDQLRDWKGSAHSRAHTDSIYLAFAELAREEAGEEVYRFCSSCHAPLAVATGRKEPAFFLEEGVTCDVCHLVKEVRAVHAGGGANASLVPESGGTRYGPLRDAGGPPAHDSAYSELHTKAELCSACHTLIHPHNGLVIENTYEEWKKGPYAAAGIACQDCHMRTVEQAAEVARTMRPVRVPGKTTADGEERPDVHAHLFVGGNVNAGPVGLSARHAALARERLKSAATMAVEAKAGEGSAEVVVSITNTGAGHAIPTSITELRQVWIDLAVRDANGEELFRSGAVDAAGRVDPDAVMYHSVLVDAAGEVTYKPWTAEKMVKERLIPPKETVKERYSVPLPAEAPGPLVVRAVLRYRSAPQEALDALFGEGRFDLAIVDMAAAEARIVLE